MACATVSAVSASAGLTTGRVSAPTSRQRICIVAGPAVRLQRNARPVAVKAVCDNRWGSSAGACGPMYSQRWRSGPNVQRSFDKWAEQASNNMWFPVDVEESAQEYTFVADVPGLGKNDIKVRGTSIQTLVSLQVCLLCVYCCRGVYCCMDNTRQQN